MKRHYYKDKTVQTTTANGSVVFNVRDMKQERLSKKNKKRQRGTKNG